MCSRVLQCVAVHCSALQCVAVYCSVLQYVSQNSRMINECTFRENLSTLSILCVDSVLQQHCTLTVFAVCCNVLQCVAMCCSVLQCVAACCSVLQHVAACCSVLQCGAVCCSVLQCANYIVRRCMNLHSARIYR